MRVIVLVVAVMACSGGGGGKPVAPRPVAEVIADAAPAAPPSRARDDLIPRSVLFGNPERTSVQISPDGRWLSWVADLDGVLNVYVAPIDDLAKAAPVTAEQVRPVRNVQWALDSTHLLYQQDQQGDENFHVMSVDLAHGNAVTDLIPAAGARVNVVATSPRKPSHVVLAVNDRDPKLRDLYTVDLTTGKKTLLLENTGYNGYALDNDLAVRIGLRLDADGNGVIEQRVIKRRKAAWKPFLEIPFEDTAAFQIVGFDADDRGFYALDARGRNTAALFRFDLASAKATLIAEDPDVDLTGPLLHPTTRRPQAVSSDFDKPIWQAIEPALDDELTAIGALFDGVWTVASRTTDDRTWIVGFTSDRASPRFYRWDRDAQQGTFLFAVQPALDELPLAAMEPYVVIARDDLRLVSYLTRPLEGDGPHPMVLLVHGGPWHRDRWGFSSEHQMLANRGYAVLSVNFRGSTGYGKAFHTAGYGQWGKAMHDDLLDAVEWAIDQRITAKDQVCIMGGSYGGYATLVGVAMTPEVFACGVDIVGTSSLVTMLETTPPQGAASIPLMKRRVGDHTTEDGRKLLEAASPLTYAADIEAPLLVAQGKNDPRVLERQSRQIVDAMKAAGIPVSYVVFPDEGHGFKRPANNIAFYAVAEAFLSVHLGGWYQPITQAELDASSMQIEEGRELLPGLPQP